MDVLILVLQLTASILVIKIIYIINFMLVSSLCKDDSPQWAGFCMFKHTEVFLLQEVYDLNTFQNLKNPDHWRE